MSHMVNRLYLMFEAIASLRARFRHHQHLLKTPKSKQSDLIEEFDSLTEAYRAGTIEHKSLGPLVGFLVSGVKGLMTFPEDTQPYGITKLAHFLVLVDQLNGRKAIEEPVWKLTQELILETIELALFPGGFEQSLMALDSANDDDKWQPEDFSKLQLAKVIETDLLIFCKNRSLFSGGDDYPQPLFELPDIPAGSTQPHQPVASSSKGPHGASASRSAK
jgi:hypothetical protein